VCQKLIKDIKQQIMKNKKVFSIFLLFAFVIIGLWACKKDNNNNGNNDIPLVFTSLTAESDTIFSGTSTSITATATGYNLTYSWSATAGNILGSGHEVIYTTPPCVPGINQITCTVKDGNNKTETKNINIVVL